MGATGSRCRHRYVALVLSHDRAVSFLLKKDVGCFNLRYGNKQALLV